MQWENTQLQLGKLPMATVPLLSYDVPIIRPVEQKPKKKNPILRAFKKFVYFKPKTFIGTTLFTAVLGAVVTLGLQTPKEQLHPKRRKVRIENQIQAQATNTVKQTVQMTEFLALYKAFSLYNDYQTATQTLQCPTCGDVATVNTLSGNKIDAACLVCKKPFQEIKADNQKEKE